jgi:hypothetical protein
MLLNLERTMGWCVLLVQGIINVRVRDIDYIMVSIMLADLHLLLCPNLARGAAWKSQGIVLVRMSSTSYRCLHELEFQLCTFLGRLGLENSGLEVRDLHAQRLHSPLRITQLLGKHDNVRMLQCSHGMLLIPSLLSCRVKRLG